MSTADDGLVFDLDCRLLLILTAPTLSSSSQGCELHLLLIDQRETFDANLSCALLVRSPVTTCANAWRRSRLRCPCSSCTARSTGPFISLNPSTLQRDSRKRSCTCLKGSVIREYRLTFAGTGSNALMELTRAVPPRHLSGGTTISRLIIGRACSTSSWKTSLCARLCRTANLSYESKLDVVHSCLSLSTLRARVCEQEEQMYLFVPRDDRAIQQFPL